MDDVSQPPPLQTLAAAAGGGFGGALLGAAAAMMFMGDGNPADDQATTATERTQTVELVAVED